MIRQCAFEGKQNWLKGALHCHTTRSDGRGTPEEVIRLHVRNGYDFMALTDHRIYNFRNFTDEKITILPGMEMDRDIYSNRVGNCFHTVCIGPEKGNGYVQDERVPGGFVHDQYEYQPFLDEIHEKGNLTIYCHPEWSGTRTSSFCDMKGDIAIEVWNSGSVLENHMDSNALFWDDLLFDGKKIFGVATDDGHLMNEHCKGWVMVNSENNVDAILDALKQGRFYSSTGPEIYDFYTDGRTAHIVCSPVSCVEFISWSMPTVFTEGENLTRAECNVYDTVNYIRAGIIDAEGRRAWTNPIFFE